MGNKSRLRHECSCRSSGGLTSFLLSSCDRNFELTYAVSITNSLQSLRRARCLGGSASNLLIAILTRASKHCRCRCRCWILATFPAHLREQHVLGFRVFRTNHL